MSKNEKNPHHSDSVTDKVNIDPSGKRKTKINKYPSFNENPKEWMKIFFKEWVLTLGIALLVAVFFRTTIASPRHIPTGSMIPTIKIGDFIFVDMFAYDWHVPFTKKQWIHRDDPKRGDVVVFEFTQDGNKDYIKRIVGIPGDTIEVIDKKVYLNGRPLKLEPLDDPQLLKDLRFKYSLDSLHLYKETNPDGVSYTVMHIDDYNHPSRDVGPFTVPADSYFVMGDNRDDSFDSRFWREGHYVPRDKFLGKGAFIWFSFKEDEFPFVRFNRMFSMLK